MHGTGDGVSRGSVRYPPQSTCSCTTSRPIGPRAPTLSVLDADFSAYPRRSHRRPVNRSAGIPVQPRPNPPSLGKRSAVVALDAAMASLCADPCMVLAVTDGRHAAVHHRDIDHVVSMPISAPGVGAEPDILSPGGADTGEETGKRWRDGPGGFQPHWYGGALAPGVEDNLFLPASRSASRSINGKTPCSAWITGTRVLRSHGANETFPTPKARSAIPGKAQQGKTPLSVVW